MLTHYRTRRRISAYLDGALDERWAGIAARHLDDCTTCRREADELRRLRALMRRAGGAAGPVDWTGFWPGVVRRIQDGPVARPVEVHWRWPRAVSRPRLAFGGAVAALVLASLTLWQSLYTPAVLEDGVQVSVARTEMPDATVMVYTPSERDIAVVWLFDRD